MSRKTREHIEGLDRQWHELEAERHARLLAKRLLAPRKVSGIDESRRPGKNETVNESGQAHLDGRTFVFLVDGSVADPAGSLTLASRRELVRRVLVVADQRPPAEVLEQLAPLVPGRHILVDARAGVVLHGGDGPRTEVLGAEGVVFESVAPDGASFRVAIKPDGAPSGAKS